MTEYVQIPETTLARDVNSFGLVETDLRKVSEHNNRKAMLKKTNEAIDKVETLSDEVIVIKEEISEIKNLLLQILNKG